MATLSSSPPKCATSSSKASSPRSTTNTKPSTRNISSAQKPSSRRKSCRHPLVGGAATLRHLSSISLALPRETSRGAARLIARGTPHGHHRSRLALRLARTRAKSRIHRHRHFHLGPWYRREHPHFQRGQRCPPASARIPRSCPFGNRR